MAKRKLNIKASTVITSSNPQRENEKIKTDRAKWVKFFRDNNIYVNDLALRAKRSGTHGAILTDKLTYASGEGLTYFRNGEMIPEKSLDKKLADFSKSVNNKGQSLHEIISHLLRGFIFSGNSYLQVAYVGNVPVLFKEDFTRPRLAKDKKKAYLSSFWRDIKSSETWDNKNYPVVDLDMFEVGKLSKTVKLAHLKADTEESDYYGLPDHIGALKWADIEYRIPTHNITKFDNGFMPSGILSMFGEPPEGITEQKYVERIRDKFTGENNNDKIIVELLDSPDQKAEWRQFDNAKEGEFRELQDLAVQNIISAHRWDGNLMGKETSSGLTGSKAQVIRTAYERVYNTVIKGYQIPVLKFINTLLKPLFKDVEVGIIPLSPTSLVSDVDVNSVLTINEGRELLGYDKIKGGEEKIKKNGQSPNNLSGGN